MRKSHLLSLICCLFTYTIYAQNLMTIPDTLSGTNLALTLHKDSVQFLPGVKTQTFAVNQAHYLGPTIIMNAGDSLNFSVTNNIGNSTTIHWHGLHVPPEMDGGPHTPIAPEATWYPHYKVMNNAATYWYHPHFHGKTALHAMKGAAGLIIIRDAQEAALNLPRRYGVDDIPLIIQSQQLDTNHQIEPRGMNDSILLVNGTINPYTEMPAQVVRLRLLNAAGERSFNFGFSNSQQFYVIGTDGGLLSAPVLTTRIRLSPGERAEVLLDLSTFQGQSLYLMSYASEIPMGTQGGPTMPMPPGSPDMNSPLNGADFNILKINVIAPTTNPVTTIPSTLIPVIPIAESEATVTRQINFTADSASVMDGPFYFNDSTFNMMRIDYHVALGSTEIWSLTNQTMVAHPFHIHDVQFQILDRDGNPPPQTERGWKDLVLVAPNETVRFIARFEDFANDTMPYMYHCHILMHEDDGMMGQFVVNEPTSIKHTDKLPFTFSLSPNPANNYLSVSLIGTTISNTTTVVISNLSGQIMYINKMKDRTINIPTTNWPNSQYILSIINDGIKQSKTFILTK